MPPRKTRASKKAQQEEQEKAVGEGSEEVHLDAEQQEREGQAQGEAEKQAWQKSAEENGEERQTMEERMAKMKELRKKMAESSMANRRAVASEVSKHKENAKQQAAMARKINKAEKILDKRDALEKGEDWERSRAWGYSIEDNERWEEMLEKKEEGMDRGAIDHDSAAERSYRRKIRQLKPDMKAYASQRPPPSSSSSTTLTAGASGGQVIKRDDLLASDSSLTYGEHTPDDAALDRVSGHLNAEAVLRSKHSRRRPDDSEAEVNYINDKNKHFNKKVARFYDSYTTEIRENFERGTAL